MTGFIPLVRRWWPLLLVCTLLAGAAAYAFASRLEPTYEARVGLLTGPINTDFSTLRASGELARTYSELAMSGPVLRAGAKAAGVPGSLEEDIRPAVSASANEVTRIVNVRVRNSDAERAAAFANAIANRLVRMSTTLTPRETEAVDAFMASDEVESLPEGAADRVRAAVTRVFGRPAAGRLQVVDEALPTASPVAPAVPLMTVLAGFAGLLAAFVFALVREHSRTGVATEEDLSEISGAPVLGLVNGLPARGRPRPQPLVVEEAPQSAAAASYRVLAAKIGLSDGAAPFRSLLVVGSGSGEGSGVVAANLAAALSEGEVRVTLVDANTTDAEITRVLDLGDRPGYGELLAPPNPLNGGFDVDEFRVRPRQGGDLDVLPRGTGDEPSMLELERAETLLDRLLAQTDLVVVNAPPIDRSATGLVWARAADATLLAVREGRSRREDVVDAVTSLSLVGANLIGTVVGKSTRRFGRH